MENTISEAITPVTTALANSINLGTIGIIVGAVITSSVGLFVGWFAIRKVVSGLKGALKGKLKF